MLYPGGHIGLEKLIHETNINSQSNVLDIGSGLGSESRFIY